MLVSRLAFCIVNGLSIGKCKANNFFPCCLHQGPPGWIQSSKEVCACWICPSPLSPHPSLCLLERRLYPGGTLCGAILAAVAKYPSNRLLLLASMTWTINHDERNRTTITASTADTSTETYHYYRRASRPLHDRHRRQTVSSLCPVWNGTGWHLLCSRCILCPVTGAIILSPLPLRCLSPATTAPRPPLNLLQPDQKRRRVDGRKREREQTLFAARALRTPSLTFPRHQIFFFKLHFTIFFSLVPSTVVHQPSKKPLVH